MSALATVVCGRSALRAPSCLRAFVLSCGSGGQRSKRASRAFQVSGFEFEILSLFGIWDFGF